MGLQRPRAVAAAPQQTPDETQQPGTQPPKTSRARKLGAQAREPCVWGPQKGKKARQGWESWRSPPPPAGAAAGSSPWADDGPAPRVVPTRLASGRPTPAGSQKAGALVEAQTAEGRKLRMQPSPAPKEPEHRAPRERAGKDAQDAESPEKRSKGAPTRERPKLGWALSEEALAAMHPTQCRRHLLFGDLLEDEGTAPSILPRESADLGYGIPDPRAWTQSLEPPEARQDRLLGILKAAEARGRLRALRLRYTRMRAEEISLLIQQQKSACAAIRLEMFLPPRLKPTRIPDPLDRQERRRVETILEEKIDGSNLFGHRNRLLRDPPP
ncbi:protein LKAAEAR1 [Glossophaga mutica]